MTMPAGKYWVGDLCYVMHEEWDEVCDLFFKDRTDQGCNEGEFTLKDGRRFVSYNTKYGDGGYYDQHGNEYGVDAGLIGCIRVEDVDLTCGNNNFGGGHIVEFISDFDHEGGRSTNGLDWDGEIRIHNVFIATGGESDYE